MDAGVEAFRAGRGFRIIELNGVTSEPERGRRGLQALRETLSAVRTTVVGGEPIPEGADFDRQVVAELVRALIAAR